MPLKPLYPSQEPAYKITIIRVGECKRCGWCCGFRDGRKIEGACPHLTDEGLCSIYDKREEYCPICGHDHKSCIEDPVLPLNKENPKCGYRFIIQDGSEACVINIELG